MEEFQKISKKIFEKPIDKLRKMWYNIRLGPWGRRFAKEREATGLHSRPPLGKI